MNTEDIQNLDEDVLKLCEIPFDRLMNLGYRRFEIYKDHINIYVSFMRLGMRNTSPDDEEIDSSLSIWASEWPPSISEGDPIGLLSYTIHFSKNRQCCIKARELSYGDEEFIGYLKNQIRPIVCFVKGVNDIEASRLEAQEKQQKDKILYGDKRLLRDMFSMIAGGIISGAGVMSITGFLPLAVFVGLFGAVAAEKFAKEMFPIGVLEEEFQEQKKRLFDKE